MKLIQLKLKKERDNTFSEYSTLLNIIESTYLLSKYYYNALFTLTFCVSSLKFVFLKYRNEVVPDSKSKYLCVTSATT